MIYKYFSYIKPKINNESIFRLLSPLLKIFFGIPNGKVFKTQINEYMRAKDLKIIESLIIKFVRENASIID